MGPNPVGLIPFDHSYLFNHSPIEATSCPLVHQRPLGYFKATNCMTPHRGTLN